MCENLDIGVAAEPQSLYSPTHARVGVMNQSEPVTTFGPPVPELPVADVERARQHYRDALGFKIGWLYPGNEIGAVSRGDTTIFFRRRNEPFEPSFTGFLRQISTPRTTSYARWVRGSLSLWRRSRGDCVSSLSRTSMVTAFTSTATESSAD